MTAQTDIFEAAADSKEAAAIMKQFAKGTDTEQVDNGLPGGIPSLAKFIKTKDEEINEAGDGILAESRAARDVAVENAEQTTLDREQTGEDRAAASDSATVANDQAGVATVKAAEALDSAGLAATYAGINHRTASWTALAAISGTAGQTGYVSDDDAGTHTDPITSATVSNAGVFAWAADGLGSAQATRIGSTGIGAERAARVAADAALSDKLGAVPIIRSGLYGATEPLTTGTAASNTLTRFTPSGVAGSVVVNRIDIFFTANDAVNFKTASLSGDNVTAIQDFTLAAPGAIGLHTYRAPADFAAFTLGSGHLVGAKTASACIALRAGSGRNVTGNLAAGATAASTTGSFLLQLNVSNEVPDSLQAQITADRADTAGKIGELAIARTGVYGATEPLVDSVLASSSSTRFFASGHSDDIVVNRIDVRFGANDAVNFKTASLSGADVTVVQDFMLAAPGAVGLHTYRAPADFAEFTLPAGHVIGAKTAGSTLQSVIGASGVSRSVTGNLAAGATAASTASTLILQMTASHEEPVPLQTQINAINAKIDTVDTGRPAALLDERYTSASGLTVVGATVSNGLHSAISSDWGSFTYRAGYGRSSISRRTAHAWATIGAANQVWGIGYKPVDLLDGTAIIVHGEDNTLKAHLWDGSSSAPAAVHSVAVPWTLNGSSVRLSVQRTRFALTATLINTVTQQSVTFTLEKANSGDAYAGRQWGQPGILMASTTADGVIVSRFQLVADAPLPRPDAAGLIIVGDSITEGSALGTSYASGWAYLVEDARYAALGIRDVVIAGRGGDESTNFLGRIAEILQLCDAQTEVWLALGTNDASQATWRTNIANAIAQIGAKTQRIRQVALAPKVSGASVRAAINADIIANYHGLSLPPIRMDLALSQANDGATWNASYNLDGTHPNAAGGPVMLAQARVDAPDVAL